MFEFNFYDIVEPEDSKKIVVIYQNQVKTRHSKFVVNVPTWVRAELPLATSRILLITMGITVTKLKT